MVHEKETTMEISGIRSALPFMFGGNDGEAAKSVKNTISDRIDISAHNLLTDEEAESVLADTISMIGSDSAAALSVHSGLSENRVFALLGI